MHRLAGRPVFSVGDNVCTWDDVVLAAYVWGEMANLETRVASDIAAEHRLDASGRGPSDDEVDEAASAWRYERDLIAADDLEAWLGARELTIDEWFAWVRRTLCIDRDGGGQPKRQARDEIADASFVDAMCSGFAREIALRLAGRTAVLDRETSGRAVRSPSGAKQQAAVARLGSDIRRRGLFGRSAAECVATARSIALADAVYDRFVRRTADAGTIAREIESRALDWTILSTDTLVFDSEGQAREAALLVREDGLPMAEVGAAAKTPVASATGVLEDLERELRDRMTSAQPGDLIGPVAGPGSWSVTLVTGRVVPSVDDRRMRARARDEIERRAVGAEIERRVRWHERF